MGKLFDSSEYVVEMVSEEVSKVGLESIGITVKTMSLTKAKDIIKVSKANATTEHLAKCDDMVCVYVYEQAFERLDEEAQRKFVEMAISSVSYDSEKDKINIVSHPYLNLFRMCQKYGEEFVNTVEAGYLAIQQIEDEEREEKERLKEERAAKKASRQQ
jgi:hypothetical protein